MVRECEGPTDDIFLVENASLVIMADQSTLLYIAQISMAPDWNKFKHINLHNMELPTMLLVKYILVELGK